jgi:hypothetical protein
LRPFNETIFLGATDAAFLAYDEYMEKQKEDAKNEMEDVLAKVLNRIYLLVESERTESCLVYSFPITLLYVFQRNL